MAKDDRSYVRKLIDGRLDELAETRSEQYVRQYAQRADGTRDERLAERIEREVHRRAAMSKELDVYEPLRWAGASFLLSAGLGVAIKALTDKQIARPAIIALMASSALTSAIQVMRLWPRYDAALKGGVDTALAMHAFDNSPQALEHDKASWLGRINIPVFPAMQGRE